MKVIIQVTNRVPLKKPFLFKTSLGLCIDHDLASREYVSRNTVPYSCEFVLIP
jgi:hypothetical protein